MRPPRMRLTTSYRGYRSCFFVFLEESAFSRTSEQIWFVFFTQLFGGANYFSIFFVAAPLKMVFPKKGFLFFH